MKAIMHRIRLKRCLIISALAIAGGLVLLLVCLAFLPSLLSNPAVQPKMQQTLSSAMKRQVGWSRLSLSWFDGVALSGLRLGDGPAPLLKTTIDHIIISPSFGRGSDGRFGVNLAVKVQNIRAELAPGPEKPKPPSTKDPLTTLAEVIQKIQSLDFPLPLDVSVLVEATPLQAVYHAPGKELRLQDFSFRFAMPSLAAKPITAEVNGRILVDGRELGNVGLTAKVSDLVTKAQRIHLASALFAVDAAAPGTNLSLAGGLSQPDGFAARVKLDLSGLLAVAQPFISPKSPQVAGNVELVVRAKTDAKRDLRATVTLDATGFAAKGGALKTKQVGPLDLKLHQQIATDHSGQRVEFPAGKLSIPRLIDVSWSASVKNPTVPGRVLELRLGPARLDFVQALLLAKPFLPPDAPIRELVGEAFIRSMNLKLTGPANDGFITLAGLGVKLPYVRLLQKKNDITAENIEVSVAQLECPLIAKLPTGLTADLLWSVRRASVAGAQPLVLQGARGKAGLNVSDLNLKSASSRKVAASAVLTQSFDLDHAALGKQLAIDNMHEQLKFAARADENGEIEASLPEVAVTIAALQAVSAGKRLAPIPVSAALSATGIHLPAAKGGRPTLQKATATIAASDFMQLAAEISLAGSAPQHAATKGTVRLDLQRILPFAAPFAPTGLKAGGVVDAHWNIAAPLPEKAFVADKNPLKNAKAGLALLDKLELGLKLDNISATVPSAKGVIKVAGLHTKPDLRFVATKQGQLSRFDGGVEFLALSGFAGAAGKLPAQHGTIVFSGELSDWRELHLSEELRIDPLAVAQEAELSVGRLDALQDEKLPFSTATLSKRLDATLFATVDGDFARELKVLLPGFDVAGYISGSVRADLAAGRELALRCSLKTRDFGVQLANGTKVEGMRSDIAFTRAYALAASQGERWTPLSTALVRPTTVVSANPGAAEIIGRISDDLRGDVRGARSFSIRRITTKTSSGVPLEITALEGDLLFNQDKTGLSFFQADLLGGTLLARAVFDLKPELPNIAVGSSFSNLDITLMLPKEARKQQLDRDAEITGEMSLTAPLTADQRELFEQLRLAVNVRKIGANTLERALFSLDPYERNEQVVAQRKMLRLGGLKGLRANAVDGAFSMEGEAYIKGVAIDIPKVERMRISELPQRQELVKNRAAITALRGVLDLVRADTLVVGPKGELSLKRRNYAQ